MPMYAMRMAVGESVAEAYSATIIPVVGEAAPTAMAGLISARAIAALSKVAEMRHSSIHIVPATEPVPRMDVRDDESYGIVFRSEHAENVSLSPLFTFIFSCLENSSVSRFLIV